MGKELRQLLNAFQVAAGESYRETCWQPPVDVYRSREGWTLKFELAGVRPEDLRVTAQARRLTLEGQRRDFSIGEGHRLYSMEISYNRFRRTVELPFDLGRCQIDTCFRNGMFLVNIIPERSRP